MKEGTPLKAALCVAGMKQKEIAREVGVDESIMSGLCQGWRNPDETLAHKIATALGRPITELFPAGLKH